jgi:hypothetical protein
MIHSFKKENVNAGKIFSQILKGNEPFVFHLFKE